MRRTLALFLTTLAALLFVPKAFGTAPTGERETAVRNSIGMELARISPGSFRMGSPAAEAERETDEFQHRVRLTRPFLIGVHEVTQEQFLAVTTKNPSFFGAANGGGPRHAVDQVMWAEAAAFCEALSNRPEERKAGRRYRLPTEAEWEYCCRAGTRTAFHYGNTLSSGQANFDGRFPYGEVTKLPSVGRTAPVGSYPPNAFGLYDMHGNVQEWCADWYDPEYYRRGVEADPPGPTAGVVRTGFQANSTDPGDTGFYLVVRGGSWLDEGRACRAAYRFRCMPHVRYRMVGFRVACDVAPQAAASRGADAR